MTYNLELSIKHSVSLTTVEKGHRSIEERTLKAMPVPKHLKEWPGINRICQVTRSRWEKG